MPKTALGIQVLPGELLAVRLRSAWRGATVERVVRLGLPPEGAADASAAAEILGSAEQIAAALPADEVFRREVALPFSELRRMEMAAPLEAEESLPLPLEELVCDVQPLERSAGRSRALVVAAPIDRVERLLGALRPLGLAPQAVDVEALALASVARRATEGDEGTSLVVDLAPRLAQAVLLQAGGVPRLFHAFSARASDPGLAPELAAFVDHLREAGTAPERVYLSGLDSLVVDEETWSLDLGVPVRRLPFPRSGVQAGPPAPQPWPSWAIPLGLALRAAAPRGPAPVNLLRGPFAPARLAAPWRQAAAAGGAGAAVLLALWAVATWLDASNRAERVRVLDEAIRATFQAALPEVKNVVSASDQLRTKVAELEEKDRLLASLSAPEASPVRVLRELSAALPRDLDVDLRDVAIDERRVRMEGTARSFRDSERIKAAVVAADPRFASVATDAKDGAEPGEVLFTLTIDLGEKAP